MSCDHDEVMPIFPVHFQGWATQIEGVCVGCGMSGFTVWEVYGFGDAAHGDPFPSEAEALAALDDFFEVTGFFLGTPPAPR